MELRRVTVPILAITPENLHFATIARDAIIELDGSSSDPGLRPVLSDGERLLAFNRDLQERSEPLKPEPAAASLDDAHDLKGDRRMHSRYPLGVECKCTLTHTQGTATGRTLNISTGGVLVESAAALLADDRIDLTIDWPYLSDDSCRLQLRVSGRVVRVDGTQVAVAADRRELHTVRS